MLDDELHLGELAASAREDHVGVDDAYALFLDWNKRRGTNLICSSRRQVAKAAIPRLANPGNGLIESS